MTGDESIASKSRANKESEDRGAENKGVTKRRRSVESAESLEMTLHCVVSLQDTTSKLLLIFRGTSASDYLTSPCLTLCESKADC